MKALKALGLVAAAALLTAVGTASTANAGYYYGRQYYGGWNYCSYGYNYCSYYYQPYYGYSGYCYNYCICYPSQPRYCYYYNPYSCTYWGRFDLKTGGYSLLAKADRKAKLSDIPEKAFPPEGKMPAIPDAKDQLVLAEPPDLPPAEKLSGATTTVRSKEATPDAPAAPAVDAKDAPAADDVKDTADTDGATATPAVAPAAPAAPAAPVAKPAAGVVPTTDPAPVAGAAAPAAGGPASGGPAVGGTPAVGGAAGPAVTTGGFGFRSSGYCCH
jgi:hypothetical protein